MLAGLLLWACWGANAYILEGTVVEVNGTQEIVVDHEEIKGFMGAMVMPFAIRDPSVLKGVGPGDRIVARLHLDDQGSYLDKIRVTGQGVVEKSAMVMLSPALKPGQKLPSFSAQESVGGRPVAIGEDQGIPTAVAFLYTRCPIPEFCPALVSRFQAIQSRLVGKARLVAVTLDPKYDTPEVLQAFSEKVGADRGVWHFVRLEPEALKKMAELASLNVTPNGEQIEHGARMLVLDAAGTLIERYDDNRWPQDRVVEQLLTGGPAAPPGSDGTVTLEKDVKF